MVISGVREDANARYCEKRKIQSWDCRKPDLGKDLKDRKKRVYIRSSYKA